MQSLQWHGQSPLAKWFAITSTMIVALLAVLAGVMLLGAIRVTAYYDIAAPSSFEWLRPYGLTTVILAWVLHMASMLLLMGFVHTENRTIASLIMTGVASLYLLFVAGSSLAALPICGMRSLM
jgi:hypothetical protein